ncbi:hypothetical protein OKT24_19945 [Aeromonas veronii]|nr:hypothetical protein [Aeromonas veronii]
MAWLFMMLLTLVVAIGGTQNHFLASYRANLFWKNRYFTFEEIAKINERSILEGVAINQAAPDYWIAQKNSASYMDFRTSSFDMTDGDIRFKRTVLYAPRGDRYTNPSSIDILDANSCGVGSASVALKWCGDKNILWYKSDSRDYIDQQYSTIRIDLDRTLSKLIKTFKGSRFQLDALSVGQVIYLRQFGSPSQQNADTCTGEINIGGVPLNCRDIFTFNGQQVGLFVEKQNRLILFADSGVRRANGSPIFLGQDVTL